MNAPGWHRDENGNERIESQGTGAYPVYLAIRKRGRHAPSFSDEGGPHPYIDCATARECDPLPGSLSTGEHQV
jgi:hypothetical protein